MAHTERKARKKAGEPFVRTPKTGTPLSERAVPVVFDQNGRTFGPNIQHTSNRAAKKLEKQIEAAG